MRLIPETVFFDESDKVKIRERHLGLIASVAAFVIWFPVHFVLNRIDPEINSLVSILCGFVLFLVIYYLLKIIGRNPK